MAAGVLVCVAVAVIRWYVAVIVAYSVAVGVAVAVGVWVEVAVMVGSACATAFLLLPVMAKITPPQINDSAIIPPNNNNNGFTGFFLRSSGISIGSTPGSAMTKWVRLNIATSDKWDGFLNAHVNLVNNPCRFKDQHCSYKKCKK